MDVFDYLFIKKKIGSSGGSSGDNSGNDIRSVISAQYKYMGIETETVYDEQDPIANSAHSSEYTMGVLYANYATSIGSSAMQYCIALTEVNAPELTEIGQSGFSGCLSLTKVNTPKVETLSNYAFYNCESLKSISLPKLYEIRTGAFKFCIMLDKLILGGNQVATLSSTTAFTATPIANGKGYIYVPDNLVDSYKTATNWSVYADQIRPISEYVEEE